MHTDSAFQIGTTHRVCQDYAMNSDRFMAGVVADGCSGSQMSDWGARFLCHYGLRESHRHFATLGDWVRYLGAAVVFEMEENSIPVEASAATFLKVEPVDNMIRTSVIGDGSMVLLFRDGTKECSTISYEGNAPFYAYYSTDETWIQRHIATSPTMTREIEAWNGSPSSAAIVQSAPNLGTGVLFREHIAEEVEAAFVFSDGLGSFVNENGEPIRRQVVLHEFLKFKHWPGKFIERRIRAFNSRCRELGWSHQDDFAVAGLYCGDEP